MIRAYQPYLEGLLHLAFPNLCIACMREQTVGNDILCVSCRTTFPYCDFDTINDNLIYWRMGSRIIPFWASSYVYFKRGNKVQRLLHALKYAGRQDIGEQMGKEHALHIIQQCDYRRPDYIVPVPLHPKKKHERGYNQSSSYARGLAAIFESRVAENLLFRKRYTSTQTNKSKLERLNNVNQAFALAPNIPLEGKSILIVDDVFTSGATLEACAEPFLGIKDIKIMLATLAIADDW